ncbi:hypothetical protein K469DRAFT_334844 [Zopfia rhizophila CBS 207.26]|uniref:Uncharacterized protein n=1 Tax=Zopfia rhizophila CBS 207.26 TaxID=1314779 RepID=A0A6A6DIK4_9PEZI|nr:hypothetical protein K469DRAFT_334844 [Zopfia rhizophila CBS 207.26]
MLARAYRLACTSLRGPVLCAPSLTNVLAPRPLGRVVEAAVLSLVRSRPICTHPAHDAALDAMPMRVRAAMAEPLTAASQPSPPSLYSKPASNMARYCSPNAGGQFG